MVWDWGAGWDGDLELKKKSLSPPSGMLTTLLWPYLLPVIVNIEILNAENYKERGRRGNFIHFMKKGRYLEDS